MSVRDDWWRVHDKNGNHVASCLNAEEAAAVVASLGTNATIRAIGDRIVWREGHEGRRSVEDYENVAHTCARRVSKSFTG